MRYLILIGLICIDLGFGYSLLSSKPTTQHGMQHSILSSKHPIMDHTDSIDKFVEWYDDMCNTFCSLTSLTDFQSIGPKKNVELKEKFSSWHIKLTSADKKLIERSFKGNLKRLMIHSCNMMKKSGMLEQEITSKQIDMMVHMGETGFDIVIDTTTYLDYYVKWTVENYNPPTGD